MPSISQITSQYQLIKYNIPVVNILFQEIKKIKDNQKNLVSNENNFQNNFQNLKIVDLSFGYQNKGINLFKKINLEIVKKDKIGIIGETGIGKKLINKYNLWIV